MFEVEREERGEAGKRVGIAVIVVMLGVVVWGLVTGLIPLEEYIGGAAELVPDPFETEAGSRLETGRFVPIAADRHAIYADALIGAIDTGNPSIVAGHFSWRQALAHALDGLDFHPEELDGLVGVFMELVVTQGFAKQLADIRKKGGVVSFVGTREADGRTWTVLRIWRRPGVIDHLEVLVCDSDSGLRGWDMRIVRRGELVQESVRMLVLPKTLQAEHGTLTGRDAVLFEHAETLATLLQEAAQGGAEHLGPLESIPEAVLADWPGIARLRVMAAADVGPDRTRDAAAWYAELHGEDPAVAWRLFESLRDAGRTDEALAALDDLQRVAAPDPYFGVLRALTLQGVGRSEEARVAVKTAVDAEPELAKLPEVAGLL